MPDIPMEKKLEEKILQLERQAQALSTQNQFFELLINNLPGLFYLFDSDFKVHKWNQNVETVTGFSAEEVQTRHLFELFTGDDLIHIQKAIEEAFAKGTADVESILKTKDDRRIPFFFTGASTSLDGKKYLIGMGIDISKRKQAENELRESEALYRILAERLTVGVILFHDFRILFANNAFAALLGYNDPSDLLNLNVMDMVAEGFDVYFRDMYEAIKHDVCRERYFQARWVTVKKNEIWVEGRANLIQWKEKKAILLTARDITEAKLTEISLKEETESLRRENITLRSSIKDRYRLGEIIGKSASMQMIYERILSAAASNANVVIYGESGTGKELVARAVHKLSRRSAKPFVPVNSSAIPVNLLESEFFGYQKGAFTGANTDKLGFLDRADGGTLFLDEVGDLDVGLQAKFLRALEGGGYSPVGSSVIKHSDFRVISATHKNLLTQIKNGEMREDFFYRIHIIPINLPPLRERKEDIPLLVEHFLKIYSHESELRQLPGEVMKSLMNYDYPGNVRELQNVIQRYLAVKSIDFLYNDAPKPPAPGPQKEPPDAMQSNHHDLTSNIEHLEMKMIREALLKFGMNKTRAAESLGVSRKTLTRKIKQFGL
ncbi:MAG: sigma-54-dependent Fis family transcriptional regulator [Desulfobacterales bacterium]|jgi:PAS domain S-box-containing protein|nr:sigma-54-dependent Fis family transcriptional regulator [Desulfobacterales bacterium]